MDLKKIYYYVICLVSLLVFAWGLVDLASASAGLVTTRLPTLSSEPSLPVSSEKGGEPYLDIYYQKKMLYDRLSDSLARIVISGLIFAYSRVQVNRLENS